MVRLRYAVRKEDSSRLVAYTVTAAPLVPGIEEAHGRLPSIIRTGSIDVALYP